MAHLKKSSNGHLLKTAGGHLVNDCNAAPASCPCASWPPVSWPCGGLVETYRVTGHYKEYNPSTAVITLECDFDVEMSATSTSCKWDLSTDSDACLDATSYLQLIGGQWLLHLLGQDTPGFCESASDVGATPAEGVYPDADETNVVVPYIVELSNLAVSEAT